MLCMGLNLTNSKNQFCEMNSSVIGALKELNMFIINSKKSTKPLVPVVEIFLAWFAINATSDVRKKKPSS